MKKIYSTKIVNDILKKEHQGLMNSNELWYKNRFGFRNKNILLEYTDYELNEIYKCSQDPIYFIEKYILKLRTYNKNLIFQFENNKFNAIASSRQIGMTTIKYAYFLWLLSFKNDFSILEISNTFNYDKLIEYYLKLPFFLKNGIIKIDNSNKLIEFEKFNKIILYIDRAEIRFNPNLTYIDNFDFLKNKLSIINYVFPIFFSSQNNKLILNSSFESKKSDYYLLFNQAVSNGNIFNPILLNIYDTIKPDINWILKKISEIGIDSYHKEYELFQKNLKIKRAIKLKKLDL